MLTAGTSLVLRSMQFALPDTSFDCTLPVLRSATVEELYEAGRDWGIMDHNLVAGDTADGDTGGNGAPVGRESEPPARCTDFW